MSSVGKGDTYRPVNQEKYEINYNAIFNPPLCSECKEKMVQWLVGFDRFYCRNLRCSEFSKVKDREKV